MKLNPKLFIDVIFPIGTSYITNNPSFNPNTAWGGTWVKDCEGQTIVGQKENDSDFGTLDNVVGEKTHTLTIEETPNHVHPFGTFSKIGSIASGSGASAIIDWGDNPIGSAGGGQAHNNIQPSKIKIIWTRTA